jgi:hypothetical protein
MLEALATLAKPRRWLTVVVKITEDSAPALRPQRVAKPSQNQRASEWPQDSVYVSWLAFIDGLRVVAGKCCLKSSKPATKEVSKRIVRINSSFAIFYAVAQMEFFTLNLQNEKFTDFDNTVYSIPCLG